MTCEDIESIGYRLFGEMVAKHGADEVGIGYVSRKNLVGFGHDPDDVEFVVDFNRRRVSIAHEVIYFGDQTRAQLNQPPFDIKAHIAFLEGA